MVARLTHSQGEFLAELRPAVALFVRIDGLNTEEPAAHRRLDDVLRMVQAVVTPYEGSVLQVTIGEKGSYLYCGFGAPLAHEDDARRAVRAARTILDLDPALPAPAQQAALADRVAQWLPAAAPRLPLLGPLVGLAIPETALTCALDPKLRKEATRRCWTICSGTGVSRVRRPAGG